MLLHAIFNRTRFACAYQHGTHHQAQSQTMPLSVQNRDGLPTYCQCLTLGSVDFDYPSNYFQPFFPSSWLRSFIPFSTPQTCWSRIPSYYQKIHSKRSWYSERSFAYASLSAIYLQSKRFRLCVSISTRYLHTPSYLSEKQCGEFDRCSGQHPSHQVQAREACNQVWIEFQ